MTESLLFFSGVIPVHVVGLYVKAHAYSKQCTGIQVASGW